jgi:hypothetical protein
MEIREEDQVIDWHNIDLQLQRAIEELTTARATFQSLARRSVTPGTFPSGEFIGARGLVRSAKERVDSVANRRLVGEAEGKT